MRISSTDNPLARRLRRYGESPRACREAGRSIVEGLHLVEAALAAAVPISAIVVSEQANPAARELACRAADSAGTRVRRVRAFALRPDRSGRARHRDPGRDRHRAPRIATAAVCRRGVSRWCAGPRQRRDIAAQRGSRRRAARRSFTGHCLSVGAQGSARRDGRTLRAVDLRRRCSGPPGERLHRRAPRG